MSVAFVANTNMIELTGLRSEVDEQYINDATVTVTVKDKAGGDVAGVTWPLAMAYVSGSDGKYRAYLSHEVGLAPGQPYTAEISANGGANLVGFWKCNFRAMVRQDL